MKLLIVNSQINNVQSRIEILDGKRHLVVPLVAMVEGVHHGSGGPALYKEEDFTEYVCSWNGVPLPVMHPSENGEMLSANTPDVINNQSVGRFFNAKIEDHKLKGEAWIDIEKAKTISPEVLEIINNNGQLQVSTSHWSEDEWVSGEWNGEAYDAIVHNIRPDHIALLPGAEGACSWQDGCGIRANNEKGGGLLELTDEQLDQLEAETKKGGEVGKKLKGLFMKAFGFRSDEVSHDDVRQKLQDIVDSKDQPAAPSPGRFHYVKEVFDDYFIYEMRAEGQQPKLFSQEFTVSEDKLELKGEPKEVREDVNYVELSAQIKKEKEETIMKREEEVQALIANKGNEFCDQDKEFLIGLSDEQFDKIKVLSRPKEEEKTPVQLAAEKGFKEALESGAKVEEIMKALEKKKKEDVDKDKPVTTEEFLANAPAEIKESVEAGLKMIKVKKDALVASLMANKANKFSKEDLEAKKVDELENIAALAHVDADFTGNLGSEHDDVPKVNEKQADGTGVPDIPKMKWNKDGSPDYSHLNA